MRLSTSIGTHWQRRGIWQDIHDTLRHQLRREMGREDDSRVAIADSQSVKTTEKSGCFLCRRRTAATRLFSAGVTSGTGRSGTRTKPGAVSGFDGGKKVKGRKRHLVVDSQGLMLGVLVSEANASERLGAVVVLHEAREKLSHLEVVWVAQGYSGQNFKRAIQQLCGDSVRVEVIKLILAAFYSDKFSSKHSVVPHSYYARYVEFLALCFCRPEEAIALRANDIRRRPNGTFISFCKAYSRGILKDTKTHEIRLFKCNEQLVRFLDSLPTIGNPNNLLFPTPKSKGYIDHRRWGREVWKPVVTKLVEQGKLHQYLKPYSLRHAGITRLVRAGIDPATIARLAGTSVEMIIRHYLAARQDVDLPEL